MPRTIKPTPPRKISAKPATSPARAAVAKTPPPEPSSEEIARRAYEIWLARGGDHGKHQEDWQQAERQLREERGLTTP